MCLHRWHSMHRARPGMWQRYRGKEVKHNAHASVSVFMWGGWLNCRTCLWLLHAAARRFHPTLHAVYCWPTALPWPWPPLRLALHTPSQDLLTSAMLLQLQVTQLSLHPWLLLLLLPASQPCESSSLRQHAFAEKGQTLPQRCSPPLWLQLLLLVLAGGGLAGRTAAANGTDVWVAGVCSPVP